MDRPVVVASRNPDKIGEIEEVLGDLGIVVARGYEWPEVDETEPTLAGNALLKARAVAGYTGLPAIGDDTGLEVNALGGAPGVLTARYAGPNASYSQNVAKLLAELSGCDDRSARFRTAVALVTPSGEEVVVEGVLEGEIGTEASGEGGFGYDPVFVVGGRTLAEMEPAEKHRISHRGRALRALRAALEKGRDPEG